MTTGKKAFKFSQISSPESTVGTIAAATEILLEVLSAPPTSIVKFMPEQERNSLSKHYGNEYQVSSQIDMSMSGDIDSHNVLWLMSNSIRGNVTATQPELATQPLLYQWLFEPSLVAPGNCPDTANGIDTFTLEYGDNISSYKAPYMFTRTITITITPNEQVTFEWEMTATSTTAGAKTGALTVSSGLQYFASNQASIYIDDTYANLGTTPKVDLLQGATWTFETGFTPRFTSSADYGYSGLNEEVKAVSLELIYKKGDLSDLELAKYDASTATYIRIGLLGETELDAGQDNPPYIWLDGAFKYTEWPEMEDEDGTNQISVTAESFEDTVSAKNFGVTVGTEFSAFA